VVQSVAA
jgi:hypothetical protein